MTAVTLDEVLSSPRLPSPPAVALKVLQLTQRSDADMQSIVDAIRHDPALTAKILRTVNSSVYGLRHKVSSVDQAATLLGTVTIGSLSLGFSLIPSRSPATTNPRPTTVATGTHRWCKQSAPMRSASSLDAATQRSTSSQAYSRTSASSQ